MVRRRTALAPLRHRPFALFWSGALLSNIGTWMEAVAAGILVTETTGQAGWTGLVAVAAFVPAIVLGPLGGALADHLPRRRLLWSTTTVQAGCAGLLALLVAHGTPAPGAIALILGAAGCASALGSPAYQALLPDLVPRGDLLGAIALSSAQWNLGRVIGPVCAGVAIAAGGYAWAFAANALSFGAVLGALLLIPLPPPPAAAGEVLWQRLRAGAHFARHDGGVWAAMLCLGLHSLLAGPFIALVPVMAITVLQAGPAGTSLLVTAQGLGAVGMALMLGPLAERYTRRGVLLGTIAALPGTLLLYAWSPRLWVSVGAIVVLGGLYLSLLSGLSTVVQTRTPAALRGRVLSLHGATLSTCYPLGAVLQGTLADHLGLRLTTTGAAVALGSLLLMAWRGCPAVRGAWAEETVAADGPASASR